MRTFSTLREALFVFFRPGLLLRRGLAKAALAASPFDQFERWYAEARRSMLTEFPNSMCLSTVDSEGWPDARLVLLKECDRDGFVFYTNTHSAKGRQLQDNPRAALTFYWGPLQRQVRVRGNVEIIAPEQADQYFASRPRGSQIGAWASDQSQVLADREVLDRKVQEIREQYKGAAVPRPPYWSGYRLIPNQFEFWQLRLNRLHDRFRYCRSAAGQWQIERLSP